MVRKLIKSNQTNSINQTLYKDANGINIFVKYILLLILLLYYIAPVVWYEILNNPMDNIVIMILFFIPLLIYGVIEFINVGWALFTVILSAILNWYLIYTAIRIFKASEIEE